MKYVKLKGGAVKLEYDYLINLIDKYPYLFDELINIYLVIENIREATLIETENFRNKMLDINENLKILKELCKKYKLEFYEENNELQRYLVTKKKSLEIYIKNAEHDNDIALGKILGFLCVGHDYSNINTRRLTGIINVEYNDLFSDIIVEICEADKITTKNLEEHLEKKVKLISSKLSNEFTVTYQIQTDIPQIERIQMLENHNIDFIREFQDLYTQDLDNYWAMDSYLNEKFIWSLTSSENFNKYVNVYKYIWREFVNKERSSKLFKIFSGHMINNFMTKFDEHMIESINKLSNQTEDVVENTFNENWKKFFCDYLLDYIENDNE